MASSWTKIVPIDHTLYSRSPEYVRNLKQLLHSRLLLQDAVPAVRPDGAAFEANDNGSIWFDSNSTPDNIMYVLTDYTDPTVGNGWTAVSIEIIATLLASARTFLAVLGITAADAALTLTNTDSEDTDGGRQIRLIAKGTQSGDEVTMLGYIEFSHEGTADDHKGQFILMLNDGDDTNTPSKQPIGFQSTGKIDVANSLCILDEDDMSSDDAEVVATQQSIKAYIDAQLVSALTTVKVSCKFTSAGSLSAGSLNTTSVNEDTTGVYTVTFDTNFAGTQYIPNATPTQANRIAVVTDLAQGSCKVRTYAISSSVFQATSSACTFNAFGAQ